MEILSAVLTDVWAFRKDLANIPVFLELLLYTYTFLFVKCYIVICMDNYYAIYIKYLLKRTMLTLVLFLTCFKLQSTNTSEGRFNLFFFVLFHYKWALWLNTKNLRTLHFVLRVLNFTTIRETIQYCVLNLSFSIGTTGWPLNPYPAWTEVINLCHQYRARSACT